MYIHVLHFSLTPQDFACCMSLILSFNVKCQLGYLFIRVSRTPCKFNQNNHIWAWVLDCTKNGRNYWFLHVIQYWGERERFQCLSHFIGIIPITHEMVEYSRLVISIIYLFHSNTVWHVKEIIPVECCRIPARYLLYFQVCFVYDNCFPQRYTFSRRF